MGYEILPYRPELKDQVLKLQTHLWSPDLALNAAYFEWKYNQNPYSDRPLIYVALYNGQVVGMRGLMGAAWQRSAANQIFICPCAADVVIHPQHRNRGLFEKLTRAAIRDAADRGYPYAFNLSASKVTVMSSLALGWSSVGGLQTMQWCPRTKYPLKSFVARAKKLLGRKAVGERNVFSSLDNNGKRSPRETGACISVQPSPRPEEMCELVERVNGGQSLRHKVDLQYFAWRFRNPFAVYRFLFWSDERLEGFLVLQYSVNRVRRWVALVDWAASNMRVWSDLLKAALHSGKFAELRIWSSTLPEDAKAVLCEHGFRDLNEPASLKKSPPTILVTPTTEGILPKNWVLGHRPLLDLNHWDLRMIFSDNY